MHEGKLRDGDPPRQSSSATARPTKAQHTRNRRSIVESYRRAVAVRARISRTGVRCLKSNHSKGEEFYLHPAPMHRLLRTTDLT